MAFGTLKADTLTHSTAGSVNTNNVIKGTAKAWWSSNDTTLKDSFNISSLTDAAASTYDFNYSNNMNNDDYAFPGATINTTANDVILTTGVTTAKVRQKGITSNSGSAVDTQPSGASIGDLA